MAVKSKTQKVGKPDGTKKKKPLTSAMGDYLEAIFIINQHKKVVRVKDIAQELHVKMPTVTSMLKNLSKRNLVYYEKYEYVELTEEGELVGREMLRRHQLLCKFLTDILKVDLKTADQEACRMEHSLGHDTLKRLADFMAFIHTCPRAGESWLNRFDEFRSHGRLPEKCREQSRHFSSELQQRLDSLEDVPMERKDK
jgi:DtxR family Mn-dependent transcriptional regulator